MEVEVGMGGINGNGKNTVTIFFNLNLNFKKRHLQGAGPWLVLFTL